MDELELIRSIQTYDNRNAFAFLVRRYQSPLRSYLRHLCGGQSETADELAQDVFIKAFNAIKMFKGESKFSTWLFQIARHAYFDSRKKPSVVFESLEESVQTPYDLKMDLAKALTVLPTEERDVVLLSYVEGFSHEEIAEIVSSPVGTVKSRIAQGKVKLARLLSGGSYELQ